MDKEKIDASGADPDRDEAIADREKALSESDQCAPECSMKLDIEREKLEIEKQRLELEKKTIHKNFGTLVTASVTLAAVFVSLGQIAVAYIAKQKEFELSQNRLEITRVQGENETRLKEIEQERRWKLDALKFVSDNMELIFSKEEADRERIRGVMFAALPREVTSALFRNLQEVATADAAATWEEGRAAITRANFAAWEGRWQVAFAGKDEAVFRGILRISLEDKEATGTYTWFWDDKEIHSKLKGNVSDDGFELKGSWDNEIGEEGRFVFRLKDGESAFSGLYSVDKNLEPDNPFNFWRGLKIRG